MRQVIASAWHGGYSSTSDGTYGVRFRGDDRYAMVDGDRATVILRLSGRASAVTVDVTPGFWRKCPELRHREIGRWLRELGLVPWPKGRPPKLRVSRTEGKAELYVEPA